MFLNLKSKKKIIKDINFLKKYKEQLIYLIELGNIIPLNNNNIRKNKYIIYECQSNIWLKIKKKKNNISINGDSNSLIIKGLLTIIISYLHNKNIKNIKIKNIKNIFKKINFFKKLIFSKTIGIKSIINYIEKKIFFFKKKII